MRKRSEKELEEITIKVMQTGTKQCPDCAANTLVSSFDEHYWKMYCTSCDFQHSDYMSGS